MNIRRMIKVAFCLLLLPLVGTALMFAFTYALPQSEDNTFGHMVYAFVLIMLGLGIPYWMAKAVFLEVHLRNPRKEKLFRLSDIGKDKDDLAKTL